MLLDHEFFMEQPILRFMLQAPCNSGGHDRRPTRRSERRSNLPVRSHVPEIGAWQSRSLPCVAHRDSYREAGIEVEVLALSLSRGVVAGSVRFVRCNFKASPNAPDLSSGFQYMGIDESCLGFLQYLPFFNTVKYRIVCNRALKKMLRVFNVERVRGEDGRLTLRKFRLRSRLPHFSQFRTAIRPGIVA